MSHLVRWVRYDWSDLQYAEKAPDEAAAVLRISNQGFEFETCYD
jgi:hypothetical protein